MLLQRMLRILLGEAGTVALLVMDVSAIIAIRAEIGIARCMEFADLINLDVILVADSPLCVGRGEVGGCVRVDVGHVGGSGYRVGGRTVAKGANHRLLLSPLCGSGMALVSKNKNLLVIVFMFRRNAKRRH